ncbi:hypothetical protein GCM10009118_24960 [Wandonia haliotis]|uniref:Lipoprotein n=1 Tax=Wandonia haliotis TaxID=574963 RepID=A0ABP3Y3E2_9FLAO
MKKVKLITLGLLLAGTTALTGCKKEGCIDANAVNYDSEAKKDDNSCKYEGRVVFWHGQETAQNLSFTGTTSLLYYVNDELVGSSAASTYWTGAPSCGTDGTVTDTKDLGIAKNKGYSYRVDNQSGFTIWSGTVNYTANNCEAVELSL